jgi:hypothetical protein
LRRVDASLVATAVAPDWRGLREKMDAALKETRRTPWLLGGVGIGVAALYSALSLIFTQRLPAMKVFLLSIPLLVAMGVFGTYLRGRRLRRLLAEPDVIAAYRRWVEMGLTSLRRMRWWFFRVHRDQVFRLCLRLSGQTALAEDATQEAFLEIYKGLPLFRDQASLGTWIYRVALRTALRLRARTSRLPDAGVEAVAASTFGPEAEPGPRSGSRNRVRGHEKRGKRIYPSSVSRGVMSGSVCGWMTQFGVGVAVLFLALMVMQAVAILGRRSVDKMPSLERRSGVVSGS